ncbi:MAG: acetate--CoA ligase family protein [Planctomycetota bacterium]
MMQSLERLFRPNSVALLGASDRPRSVGALLMRNLLNAGFSGAILPVNPHDRAIAGVLAYPDIASLPVVPDLAVIATPPATVPGIVRQLGARGTAAAVIITAGLREALNEDGRSLEQATVEAARLTGMRFLGPNCVGLLVPGNGLNASFAPGNALPGRLAFVAQSGALCAAVLDWATSRGIGFSHFVSLGNCADVDFGDVLEYLATDTHTDAILLYIEAIIGTRKFLSAARAASQRKPIIAIKAGRAAAGARAAHSHTGALAGSDLVYDAALRRAGVLRVDTFQELFAAVETLSRGARLASEEVVVVTNGGGPGVLAADALAAGPARLAELDAETIAALDGWLPAYWSHANPIDLVGDADAERYRRVLETLSSGSGSHATLVLHCPTTVADSDEVAGAVAQWTREHDRKCFTCFLGGAAAVESRRILAAAQVPTYETPEEAVRALHQLVAYGRIHADVRGAEEVAEVSPAEVAAANSVMESAVLAGRVQLGPFESLQILRHYGFPVIETYAAATAKEAASIARKIAGPIALKLDVPDHPHKSDYGGVALGLGADEVELAAERMLSQLLAKYSSARPRAYLVQRYRSRADAHELLMGIATDAAFGPVVLFGAGGTAVEVLADCVAALPPLTLREARDLIDRTRVVRLLRGYRNRPRVDFDALALGLVRLAQLAVESPLLVELDINPLFADASGVLAIDARARLRLAPVEAAPTLAERRLVTPMDGGGK